MAFFYHYFLYLIFIHSPRRLVCYHTYKGSQVSLYLVLIYNIVSKCLLSLVMSYPSASLPSDTHCDKSMFGHFISYRLSQVYGHSDHYNIHQTEGCLLSIQQSALFGHCE